MMPLRALLLACLAGWALAAQAGASTVVCFNYGCARQTEVSFDDAQLESVRAGLAVAGDAAAEREALARAIGTLLAHAGAQAPIAADRAGNLLDDGVEGRMDCIDHATTTTRLLILLEERGWLRFHRMLPPERRSFLILQHFSAVIEEIGPAPSTAEAQPAVNLGARFALDSWFVDHGEPAVVLPLEEWMMGEGPNVQ